MGGPPVVQVDLVQLPGTPKSKASKGMSRPKRSKKPLLMAKRADVKPIVRPKMKKKPVVISKKTVKRKKPSDSISESSKKHMDNALDEIEKKVRADELDESHLDSALEKLASKAKESDGEAGRGPAPGGGGVGPGNPLDLYKLMVRDRIRENWSYPVVHARLEDIKGIQAIVELKVNGDGSVLGHEFREKSSDALFDQSVLKAIEKTKSVPPIPDWYMRSRGITQDTFIVYFSLSDLLEE
jgi:colicin import membrane protein